MFHGIFKWQGETRRGRNYTFELRQDNLGLAPSYFGAQVISIVKNIQDCIYDCSNCSFKKDSSFQQSQLFFSMSPSPASEIVAFNFNTIEEENVTLEIYNIEGKCVLTVFQNEILSKGETLKNCDISSLPSGMYFLKGKFINETRILKFIKV